MLILGIYDGHNCSAALMIDGEIKLAVSEERFNGLKNISGFPKLSIDFIIKKANININEIDVIAFCGTNLPKGEKDIAMIYEYLFQHDVLFTVKEQKEFMENYWKPKLSGLDYDINYVKKILLNRTKSYYLEQALLDSPDLNMEKYSHKKILNKLFQRYFGLKEDHKIQFIDHHRGHILHAYFSKEYDKSLINGVTIDGWGDGRNQTVWSIEDSNFKLLSESDQCEIARIYRMITLFLNMRPLEHEFKVMGLAPYAKSSRSYEVTEFLNTITKLDGLKFIHNNRQKNMYEQLKENLKYYRFDDIARGLQDFVELNLVNLFRNIYLHTGSKKFVYAGGVAMNVKANKTLHEQNFVDELFVPGAPDDQGTCIGACYEIAKKHNQKVKQIKNYYLGQEIQSSDTKNILIKFKKRTKLITKIIENCSIDDILNLLIKGQIVGRASGAMEFGSRALGNRSIFANPSIPNVVQDLNETIKNRDFWMPFAGTVCEELVSECLVNPKLINGSFMTIAFSSYEQDILKSVSHPYDRTIRAQILTKEQNPWYHELIMKFYDRTNIPMILNTSLNIHGEPIVNDENKTLDLFEKTDLKHIIVGNHLISKLEN